jgi:hypothetical protein
MNDSRIRCIPFGLTGAVAVVLLVESWVFRHALDFTTVGIAQYGWARRAADAPPKCEVLCLGDSLVKRGVIPRVLERRLGGSALNLACEGSIAPLTFAVLKRALDRGDRPSAVIVDFKSTQLQTDPRLFERAFAEVLTPGDALELAWVARDGSFFARQMALRLLPSVRGRDELRRWVLRSLQGDNLTHSPSNAVGLRNWRVNRGAELHARNPRVESVAEHHDEAVYKAMGRWYCDPVNAVYLHRFLKLAAERGIPVYWVLPPINPRVQALRDRLGHDDGFDRMIRKALSRFPNLTVVDGRASGYPARYFVDGSHLDADGAFLYSDDLAGILASLRGQDRPRWVTMTPFRARPVPIPLEDLERSRSIVLGAPPPADPHPALVAAGASRAFR